MAAISRSRPSDKMMADKATGRVSLEWDAFFKRLESGSETASLSRSVQEVTADAASLTVNLANGHVVALALNATVTSFTLENATASGTLCQATLQITNGGSYAISSWPSGIKWQAGVAPVITLGSGKLDVVVLTTIDGGTTWLGYIVAQNMV